MPPRSAKMKRRIFGFQRRVWGRKRRRDVDRRSRDGMGEGEPGRVEELALEAEVSSDPVDGVAGDREIDRGEVHADLVRSPGLESDAQECMVREQLLELEVRHG